MSKKYWEKSEIVENNAVIPGTYRMTFRSPAIAVEAKAGQFLMLKINDLDDPLLNRPLGIAAADIAVGTVTVYYRVVGKGTELLTKKESGDQIHVVGPLGNGFDMKAKKPLLIGGGMGLAPLLFAAQKMCPTPVDVIIGGRTKEELFWFDLFANVCQHVHVTTDDGSLGTKGTCVSILPQLLNEKGYDVIMACGPSPMLRAVAECSNTFGVACQVSLEKHMACGFGACLTCTCETKSGDYVQVCKHGPVFNAEEVKL